MANMAADKFYMSALEHCNKATVLGNTIAIHMLEYLNNSTTASSENVDQLAHDFLQVCRLIWSIEIGLTRTRMTLPPEMCQELNTKLQITYTDFQALDQWLSKTLQQGRKGGGSSFRRGWRKMFSENETTRMIQAMSRTKEALRLGALVFQWSLGEIKTSDAMGIGYTALSAALEQMDDTSNSLSKKKSVHSFINEIPGEDASRNHLTPPTAGSIRYAMSSSTTIPSSAALPPRADSYIHPLPELRSETSWADLKEMGVSRPSTPSNHTTSSRSIIISPFTAPTDYHSDPRTSNPGDFTGLGIDDDPALEVKPGKIIRLSVNPAKMPRWSPRNMIGGDTPAMRLSLMAAIQERNSKAVEHLLDRGVSTDLTPDHHALREAIAQRDLEIVRLLLLFGADANTPDKHGISPLMAATSESFVEGASILLKYGADPNRAPTQDHDTPFAIAVSKEDSVLTRLFLAYGGNLKQFSMDGETILTKSITKNCNKVLIDAILEYGADANGKTKEGKTPLFSAITAGRVDIVTSLLDHGANPNLPGPKHMLWPATYQPPCLKVLLARGADHKKTPGIMELASSINNIDSVRILLKAGVNPNAKKDGAYTPLCTSIRDDHADIFQLLLANGADPNVPASEYPAFKCVTHYRPQYLEPLVAAGANLSSPKGIIETAVQHNNLEALKWLIQQGVSPNDKAPRSGATPLTTAIRENKPDMVEYLLAHGANPNVRGEDWPICMAVGHPGILRCLLPALSQPRAFKGVMERAVQANQLDSVRQLLAAGVSVEDRNGGVFSPLTTAIRERRKDIVRYLLEEAGADPNAPGEHIPIVKALRRYEEGDTEVLELLLAKGADPNKVYRGHSAIIQTIEMGDAYLLSLMVDRCGVDLDASDDSGRTPVEIAEMRGWDEGRDILLKGRKPVL
ncbi:ankyrin repeat-containing domain protein [Xylariomycetidae sp. FL2044]|nr:ankyrin repeat-containing domain protein [Xylariomycetidae sp. FL2044]